MSDCKYNVLFILLTCSSPAFLKYQLKNILHFNPNSLICINMIHDLFPYKKEILSISENIVVKDDIDEVIVKPHSNGRGYHKAWMSCYSYCKDKNFSYICLLSSNELFFKFGAHEYMEKQKIVSYLYEDRNIKNDIPGHEYYRNGLNNKLFSSLNLDYCVTGQWEGSFFTKETFSKMYDFIKDKLDDDHGQSCEEVLLPSLLITLNSNKKYIGSNTHITKVNYIGGEEAPLEWINLPDVYSLKRVSYGMDSSLFHTIDKLTKESLKSPVSQLNRNTSSTTNFLEVQSIIE